MDGSEYYSLKKNEKLIFGIKTRAFSTKYILRKEISNENKSGDGYLLSLTSKETDIPQGEYCFDVALLRDDGELVKIIGITDVKVIGSVVRSDVEC